MRGFSLGSGFDWYVSTRLFLYRTSSQLLLSGARSDHVIFYRRGAALAAYNVYILCHNLSGGGAPRLVPPPNYVLHTYVLCMVGLVKPDFCSIDVQ